MGGVKYGYLKYEAEGDQCVGQCATGKDKRSKTFSPSPAYFYFPRIDEPEQRLATEQSI